MTKVPIYRNTNLTYEISASLLPKSSDDLNNGSFLSPASLRRLIQFPPPPMKGGITVTMEDLQCLDSGQYLNDVIIDFYLKYELLFFYSLNKRH